MYDLYQQINWQASWYRTLSIPPCPPHDSKGDCQDFATVKDWLNHTLTSPIYNAKNLAIEFVSQNELPPNTAYETLIANTGKIPTRDNFHDLLGGVIWHNYPKTKAVFNALHQQDISEHGITAKRTPLRNLLTVFDENGGIVVSCDNKLLQALQQFDWHTALWECQAQWASDTAFFAFGHALLEKLITPRLPITGHCLLLHVDSDFFGLDVQQQRDTLDNWLSALFWRQHNDLNSKMFQPLPILGIPQFCECQSLEFYQNKSVFRDKRNTPPVPIFALNRKI